MPRVLIAVLLAAGCATRDLHATLELEAAMAPPRATVLLAHGFLRDGAMMRELASALAAAGFSVVVPDLPHAADHAANGRFLADLAEKASGPVIFAGFSAGGLAALHAAGESPRTAGWIGLDPVDRRGEALELAPRLSAPAYVVRAEPAPCNANGNFAAALARLPRLERDLIVPAASHCDFEDPTDALCRIACGAEAPERQRAIRDAVVEAAAAAMSR